MQCIYQTTFWYLRLVACRDYASVATYDISADQSMVFNQWPYENMQCIIFSYTHQKIHLNSGNVSFYRFRIGFFHNFLLLQEEEISGEDNEHWHSPFLVKVVCIIVITQFVVHHVEMFEKSYMHWYDMMFAMLQLLVLFATYTYTMVTHEQDSAW